MLLVSFLVLGNALRRLSRDDERQVDAPIQCMMASANPHSLVPVAKSQPCEKDRRCGNPEALPARLYIDLFETDLCVTISPRAFGTNTVQALGCSASQRFGSGPGVLG